MNGYDKWPRPPKKDNGVGVHFGDVRIQNVQKYLPEMKAMGITWTVLCAESDGDIAKAVPEFLENGIMPVVRVDRKINRGQDWYSLTRKCGSAYMQIYNEPSDEREWARTCPRDHWAKFRDKWMGAAHGVRAAGGFPGLQVTSPFDLQDMLNYMKATGDDVLWPDMWLSLHLYPHKGCPPSCMLHEDDVLGFLRYAEVCLKTVGYVFPIIVTEGGYTDGMGTPEWKARAMTEIYGWFKTGVLSNGQPLPDYLFAFCPFILADQKWYGFSWLTNSAFAPMVEAVKAMGDFVRYSGDVYPGPNDEEIPNNWRVVSPWMAEEEAIRLQSKCEEELGGRWSIEKQCGA